MKNRIQETGRALSAPYRVCPVVDTGGGALPEIGKEELI